MEPREFLIFIISIVVIAVFAVVLIPMAQNTAPANNCGPTSKGFCNQLTEFCKSMGMGESDCYSLIISSVAAQTQFGEETCESLEPFYRNKCYAVMAKESVASIPAKAEVLCDKITEDSRRAWCLQDLAVYSFSPENDKAVEICEGIFDLSLVDECLQSVAKRASDFSLEAGLKVCGRINLESQKEVCRATVTQKYDKDEAIAICNALEDDQERLGCLTHVNV
jgi:hypothetical protein